MLYLLLSSSEGVWWNIILPSVFFHSFSATFPIFPTFFWNILVLFMASGNSFVAGLEPDMEPDTSFLCSNMGLTLAILGAWHQPPLWHHVGTTCHLSWSWDCRSLHFPIHMAIHSFCGDPLVNVLCTFLGILSILSTPPFPLHSYTLSYLYSFFAFWHRGTLLHSVAHSLCVCLLHFSLHSCASCEGIVPHSWDFCTSLHCSHSLCVWVCNLWCILWSSILCQYKDSAVDVNLHLVFLAPEYLPP